MPGTVLVFDQTLETLLHVFPPTVEDDPAELEAWEADHDALGEGVLLQRNGHLFVVKEDKPRQLLEFGLPGARAEGLREDLPTPGGRDARPVACGHGVEGQPGHRPTSCNKAPGEPEQATTRRRPGTTPTRRTAVAMIAT